jgi:aminopeptidase
MPLRCRHAAGIIAAVLLLTPPAGAQTTDKYRQLAHHIVVDVADVKSGDVDLITTTDKNMTLVEDLIIELRKVGAWPIVDLFSDRANLAYYSEDPPSFDPETPEAQRRLMTIVSAQINIDEELDPSYFQNVSPKRQSDQGKAFVPVTAYQAKHGIPFIEVGNGLYPSKYTAKQFAISTDQLTSTFWSGVNETYATVHANAQRVHGAIAAGHTVHVTDPNGTDITFGVTARPMIVSDGSLRSSTKRNGSIPFVGLPAGDVVVDPVPGSAHGTVVFNPEFFNNTEVDGMTLKFANGVMTSMNAKAGLAAVKAFYDTSTAGKGSFTFADFGVNPGVTFVPGSKMFVPMAAGMVTLGMGGDVFNGGTDTSTFLFTGYMTNATVTVDGKALVVKGKLAV